MSQVETRHPTLSTERREEWKLMGSAYIGESDIKAKGERYLPFPGGFSAMPDQGRKAYLHYKQRAQFPELLKPSLAAMVGLIHSRESQIEMPEALRGIEEQATADGLNLETFHRRITRNLLLYGRYGLLTDAPADGGEPFLTGYHGSSVINWDDNFFVLDETHKARFGFEWRDAKQYRVLELIDGRYVQTLYRDDQQEQIIPHMRGGLALEHVPFSVANAIDVTAELHSPPLIGIANAALAIYQLDADYRHQLFWSGQETAVLIGADAPEAVGAGVVIQLEAQSDGVQPDFHYAGPSCKGIDAHERAIRLKREEAAMAGARLLNSEERLQESGEAKKLRGKSETATLTSIAQSSCALLERGLRSVAIMKGLDPNEVIVTPPENLFDAKLSAQDAVHLMQLWQGGSISHQTYYEKLQQGGIASMERSYEDEARLIDQDEFGDMSDEETPQP